MKVLVTYFSQTGNTRKIADVIYDELECEKEIKELSDVESVDEYDLLFVGFPIQAFEPAKPAKEFLKHHCPARKVALFITHSVPGDFAQLSDWLATCMDAAAGADVAGMFDCQGEVSDVLLDAALKSDDPVMHKLGEAGATSKGKPDEECFEQARTFTREIMGNQ